MIKRNLSILLPVLTLLVLTVPGAVAPVGAHPNSVGTVFIMSNSASGNQVIAYAREANGSLTQLGTFSTNGLGTGSSLGDQGALALSKGGEWLLAVNAGSNDISLFKVNHNNNDNDHHSSSSSNALTLVDKIGSGGVMPVSVTVNDDNVVYVVNAGSTNTPANIAGFHLSDEGKLSSIPGSTEPLSSATPMPAQISFNPEGGVLAVTEKATNIIDIYTVNDHGVAAGPITNPSHGMTPFGFAFDDKGRLIVSEAMSGALSSYSVSHSGNLTTISGTITDGQAAACWVMITGNNRYAYTTNTHSNSISSYTIGKSGTLTLLQSVAASTGAGPTDMALSGNSRFLYVFDSGANAIQGFSVQEDGSLTLLLTVSGIPTGAAGLAAN